MALEEYRKKRNFKVTPEPPGKTQKSRRSNELPIFMVQKHQATRLHYEDKGTYQTDPEGSAAEQLTQGELKFTLDGKKLQGGFALIRTGLESTGARGRRNWLLIKRQDEYADPSWNIDHYDWSALTGRNLEEIAAGLPHKTPSQQIDEPAAATFSRSMERELHQTLPCNLPSPA